MSIGKLAAGQESYYLNAVAPGVEDYYTGAGEAPGRWLGGGARALGLAGTSSPMTCARFSAGSTRVRCGVRSGEPEAAGVRLHVLGPEVGVADLGGRRRRHRAEVVAAHDAAVVAALGYLERQAAFVRRGKDGLERMADDRLRGGRVPAPHQPGG